jgi:hypothetical protein
MAALLPESRPVEVGQFEDCTPHGFSDVVCKSGLRCGFVLVGNPPNQGSVAQCVPVDPKPLALDAPCQFDQGGAPPVGMGGPPRYYDRCAPGLACVQTETQGYRCRKVCALRHRDGCGKELCVLPTQVTGTGYCQASQGCQPVFPQTGCGKDMQGNLLGCYVLTDDKGGGTFCLRQQSYGDSTGALDSACERAANCQAGLGCVAKSGRDSVCRPYCALPETPDGGSPPDLGGGVACSGNLGTCTPIAGYDRYGRCL